MSEPILVAPNDVCRYFDRVSWSLIEEPDICELCIHYDESHSHCLRGSPAETARAAR